MRDLLLPLAETPRRMVSIVSSERHRPSGVDKIAQASKRRQVESDQGPLDRQSGALTT